MDNVGALQIIATMMPSQVLVAIAEGLVAGYEKHGVWDSSQPLDYYFDHLEAHFQRWRAGEFFDRDDHHTNGSAVIIRAALALDKQIKQRRLGCPVSKPETETQSEAIRG